MLKLAQQRGCDIEAVLTSINSNQDEIDQQESCSIHFYSSLYHAIIKQLKDEWFGLLTTGKVPNGAMRFFFQSIVHCKTLRQAMDRSACFFEISHGFNVKQTFIVDNDDIILKISKLDHMSEEEFNSIISNTPINVIKSTLLAWQGINTWLTGASIPLKELFYTFSEGEDTSVNPKSKINYNQDFCGYRIGAEFLKYPIVQQEQNIDDFMNRAPYFVYMHSQRENISQQIKSILTKSLGSNYPTSNEIASYFNISPQTLFRRLKAEGVTYLELKNNTRSEAAIHFLNRREMTNESISELLGFENPSTFYRAFKKWTGLSPGEYRKKLQKV
jgi:AraC-like DNA-binding protein